MELVVAEATRKIQEIELTFRNITRSELSETNAKLNASLEGSSALEDRVRQTEIRSPVNGDQATEGQHGGGAATTQGSVEAVP
ncbi:MAG: hypothetical protein IPG23_14925 [Burkholderiales bacterium]|nr:hypothetical protein [Burkholderiales bacterium]